MVSTGIKSYVAVHIHNSKLIIKHVQLCNQFMSICHSGYHHAVMWSALDIKLPNQRKDLYILSKRLFWKRERQGLVGSLRTRPMCRARLGSRTTASSGPECAISLAAARRIRAWATCKHITTHNVLQVCISIMSCDCFGIANSSERIQSIHVYYK